MEASEGGSTRVPTGAGSGGWGLCSFSKFRVRRSKGQNQDRLMDTLSSSHHPAPSSHIFWTHPGQPELTLRCEVAQYVGALNFPEGLGKHHPILAAPLPQGFNSPLSLEHHRTPVDWETLGTEPGTLFSGSLGCYPHLLSPTYIKVPFGSGPVQNPFLVPGGDL